MTYLYIIGIVLAITGIIFNSAANKRDDNEE